MESFQNFLDEWRDRIWNMFDRSSTAADVEYPSPPPALPPELEHERHKWNL